MKKFTLGGKLKNFLYLQGFGENPELYTKIGVRGHIGTDLSRGYESPIPALYAGTVTFLNENTVVYLTDPDTDGFCLEISHSHGKEYKVVLNQRVKVGDVLCVQGYTGLSVMWQVSTPAQEKIGWSHEHINTRIARRTSTHRPQNLTWNFAQFSPIPYEIVEYDASIDHFRDPNVLNERVLYRVAKAIESFEDYVPPGGKYKNGTIAKSGSISWRNNNPGNIKGKNLKFIKFPSYEKGFAALCDYLERVALGKHAAYPYGISLKRMMQIYAPSGDNNSPLAYAAFIMNNAGLLSVHEPIADILLTEFEWLKKYKNLSFTTAPKPTEVIIVPAGNILRYLWNMIFARQKLGKGRSNITTTMSSPIILIIVNLIVNLLPLIGITVSSENLETTIQVITAVVSGIVLWIDSVKQKKALIGAQRVNVFGGVKKV